MSAAFTSTECDLLEQALETAWDIFLRTGRREAHDVAKAALTRAILDSFEEGERNPRRLAIAAVAQIDAFEARIERDRSEQSAA